MNTIVPFDPSSIITDVENPPASPVRAVEHVGILASNAAESTFWGNLRRGPSWERMSSRAREVHIETCPATCVRCRDHRAWGECTSCGDTTEALGSERLGRCCGSTVILGGDS